MAFISGGERGSETLEGRAATVRIYRRLAPIVEAKCARMLRDPEEARDVVQETFRRLFAAKLRDASDEVLTAWVYRTSTRVALDLLRRRKVRNAEAEPEGEQKTEGFEARSIARSELERIARDVPRKELTVIVLHRVDGLTQPEVAELMGLSERTVRRLVRRFEARRLRS